MSAEHYIYQRVHVLAGRPLHLDAHLDFAARAFEHVYGMRPELDRHTITTRIAGLLRTHRVPARGSATVMLRLTPGEEGGVELSVGFERVLLDAGYTHSSLRPMTLTFDYSIPFGGFPTAFQLSAKALFDTISGASRSASRSVRREGDKLLSCGDAPLFAIRGRKLFTTPLTEGAMDTVERRLVAEAAAERFTLIEETLRHSEMREFDELFYVDAAGITSIAGCDGAKFMSLAAPRLAAGLNG